MFSLPASIERIGSNTTEKRWRHPHYKSMGAFCCHGSQSFDPICPKTLCSLSPTPVMLHLKFDQDWPTGFRDIQVWKCGRRTDGPLVYYKLILWAFGSGELKTNQMKKLWKTYIFMSILSELKKSGCRFFFNFFFLECNQSIYYHRRESCPPQEGRLVETLADWYHMDLKSR